MQQSHLHFALVSSNPSVWWAIGQGMYHRMQPGKRDITLSEGWSGLRWQTHSVLVCGKHLFLGLLTCKRRSAGLCFWQATCLRPACWCDLPKVLWLWEGAKPEQCEHQSCTASWWTKGELFPSCLLTNCTAVVLHVSTCIADLQRQTRNVLHARQWRWAITLRQPSWGNHGPWVNKTSGESTDALSCSLVKRGSLLQWGCLYSLKRKHLAKTC